MDVYQNMDGKYWRTCNGDITSSEGWFKKIMLLGLVNLVPVFGQMTVQGYAYEWAHKAAWGVSSPMPGKIYGRVGSKMLRWGWFVIVIAFLFMLVPYLLGAISDSLSTSAAATSAFWAHTSGASLGYTVKTVLSFLLSVAALVALVLNAVMAEVGIMRMVVYDKLGAGFQLQAIWKMMKQDATGLLRVVGMAVLFTCVVMAIVGAIALVLVVLLAMVVVLGGAGSLIGSSAAGAAGGSVMSSLGPVLVMAGTLAVPVLLVLAWVYSCGCVWVSLLTARGMGYWTAQFCVAHWGTQADPLPFEQPGYEQNRARWQQEQWQAQQQEQWQAQQQAAQAAQAQQPDAQQPEAQAAEAQQPEAQAATGPEAQAPEAAEQPQAGSDEAVEPDAVEEPAGEEPAEQGGPAEEDVIEVEAEPEPEAEAATAAEPAPAAEPEAPAAAEPAPAAEPEEPASPADAQA